MCPTRKRSACGACRDTAVIPARQRLQELLGRLIERNSIAAGAQQLAKSRAERCIVIDDVNDRRQSCHAASILDNGIVKQKTAPPPGRFSAHILPPWVSTIARAMDRPSPVPSRLVV